MKVKCIVELNKLMKHVFFKDHVKKGTKYHCLVLSLLCKIKEKKLFETFISNL